jgi:serine/threonine-protein kinase
MSVQSEEAFPMLWLDASGKTQPILSQTARYGVPRLSPDGKRLAFRNGADVWCYDLQGGVPRQLTFNESSSRELAWAPDSRHIVYGDSSSIWWVSSEGGGQPQQLAANLGHPSRPMSVAPDGRVAFSISTPDGIPDLYTLPLDLANPDRPKPGTPAPFLNDPSVVEVDGAFSPDGKFMAYASSESGTMDIFVRAFPGPSGKWKISGGHFPAWARAGRQLFYLGEDDHIMVVDYSINGASFSAGEPRVWSPATIRRTNVFQNFDISPDGKRAVIFPAPLRSAALGSLHVTFLLNFFDELQRRLK